MNPWPVLDFDKYATTLNAVHLWTQIVGKIRLIKMPWLNHSWHVSLYVTPRGFTTGSVPYSEGLFEIHFDFLENQLWFSSSQGQSSSIPLQSGTISDFYHQVFAELGKLDVECRIHPAPNEIDPAIPFQEDHREQVYDPEQMKLLWQAMVAVEKVFTQFRSRFIGKTSPVHLFWGAFDLAVTRFSGRTAPKHPGGMPNMPLEVMQEAYSHEVSSAGFWPGSAQAPQPVFYSYCYPVAESFGEQPVVPAQAFYSEEMGEFFLPYEAVQSSKNPEAVLMDFLQSTYQAAAQTGNWDRASLEFDFSSFERK